MWMLFSVHGVEKETYMRKDFFGIYYADVKNADNIHTNNKMTEILRWSMIAISQYIILKYVIACEYR